MRSVVLIGAAAVAMGLCVDAAEARGGRGFGGLRLSKPATMRSTYVSLPSQSRIGDAGGTMSLRLDQSAVMPQGRVVRAVPAILASEAVLASMDATDMPLVQLEPAKADAKAEWCPRTRLVGSGVGFCQIN